MLRALSFFLLAGLTGACSILGNDDDDSGGKADGFGDDTCDLPEYGDGTCQADLACAVPDIDCFVTFEDDAAAGAWFMKFEELAASQEFREPRAQVPESDPRFQRMRELLDRGWQAYQETNPVGDLAEHRPALVVLEDASVNAFVAPDIDTGKAGFAVMVQTGALDLEMPEAPMLGLVMHELEHAVALHIVADVKDRIRRYYVADGYSEPFGFEQLDDPVAREHGELWRELASEAGPFTSEYLGGLPVGGQLSQIFDTVVVAAASQPGCAEPIAALEDLRADIAATRTPIDGAVHPDASVRGRVDAVLAGLRDSCLASFDPGFIEVVAGIAMTTPEEVRASLSAEDIAMVDGVHFIDAIAALGLDRRTRMRAAEGAFAAAAADWTSLRFYSYEEAADDATVPVLHAMDLAPAGLGTFFLGIFDDASKSACSNIIDSGRTPPYGSDLADEHHATCWRVDHVTRLAASGKLFEQTDDPAQYLRQAPPVRRARPRLIPPRLKDLIAY